MKDQSEGLVEFEENFLNSRFWQKVDIQKFQMRDSVQKEFMDLSFEFISLFFGFVKFLCLF